jgi:hypothetical protein
MATKSIKVTINLDALRGDLQRSLQRAIYLVASGLNAADHVRSENLYLQGKSTNMVYDSSLNWNTEQLRGEFNTWLLSNGFRDSIEAINSFLKPAHKIMSAWELAYRQNKGEVLTGADWQKVTIDGTNKYHKYGFPDKIIHLKTEHNLILEDSLVEQVLSINFARNCLVHRNGIVTNHDLNSGDKLVVKWSRIAILIQSKDGEKEFLQGKTVTVNTGEMIEIQNKDEFKQFALGQRIQFSPQEFADITWGLFRFGSNVVMKINEYGLTNGFIKSNRA